MASYLLIKQLHMLAAGLSLALFVLRAWWSVRRSPQLGQRWVRILPHVIDTLLLTAGVTLMILLEAWPTRQPWLAAKLVGLVAYIGVGTIAIKRGRTPAIRGVAALVAIVIFAYIVGAAITHDPLSWWRMIAVQS
ncbi:SirB2 family protein [Halomonas sp. GXIMD04776]|uniref:SirB2 family protein n=1 Tax=Halomonas sp. GXIMD04776 TaxID=3415605 RepID=UPI003CBB07FF